MALAVVTVDRAGAALPPLPRLALLVATGIAIYGLIVSILILNRLG